MRLTILASTAALHMPDGFLTLPISVACWLLTIVVLYLAVRNSQASFEERLVPLAGIMAAFIFAGQMINFPVAGGTSGHLIGAALATIVLGPWLGILVMSAVVILQALLFQDGGLVVMGANILVMGLAPAAVGYGLFRLTASGGRRRQLAIAGVAGWLSVMAGAFVTAMLLWLSGTVSLAVVVPAMLGWHALIGLGEALITVAALSFVMRTRPAVLQNGASAGGKGWAVAGILATLSLLLLAPLASTSPDGLERVAEQAGFLATAQTASYELLPDYTIPALGGSALSTVAAGAAGVLVLVVLVSLLARLLRRPLAARSSGKM